MDARAPISIVRSDRAIAAGKRSEFRRRTKDAHAERVTPALSGRQGGIHGRVVVPRPPQKRSMEWFEPANVGAARTKMLPMRQTGQSFRGINEFESELQPIVDQSDATLAVGLRFGGYDQTT